MWLVSSDKNIAEDGLNICFQCWGDGSLYKSAAVLVESLGSVSSNDSSKLVITPVPRVPMPSFMTMGQALGAQIHIQECAHTHKNK